MFVGINMFWARLGLILALAVSGCITNIILFTFYIRFRPVSSLK